MAADAVSTTEIDQTLTTYAGYLDDLAHSEFDGARTKLRLVVNFSTKDHTLRPLTELLRLRYPTARFLDAAVGDTLDLPSNPLDLFAFRFDLLLHVKRAYKLNLREILSRRDFAGGGMDDRWKLFCERIVTPLREGVEAIRDSMRARFPTATSVNPLATFEQSIDEVFGSAPAPAAPVQASHGSAALDALASCVRALGLSAYGEQDLLTDVELVALELKKTSPSRERLEDLVCGFRAASAACGASAARCAGLEDEEEARAEVPQPELEPEAPQVEPEAPKVERVPAPAPAPDAGLEAARAALEASQRAVRTERAALDSQRSALSAERRALEADREALVAERGAFELERGAG